MFYINKDMFIYVFIKNRYLGDSSDSPGSIPELTFLRRITFIVGKTLFLLKFFLF